MYTDKLFNINEHLSKLCTALWFKGVLKNDRFIFFFKSLLAKLIALVFYLDFFCLQSPKT